MKTKQILCILGLLFSVNTSADLTISGEKLTGDDYNKVVKLAKNNFSRFSPVAAKKIIIDHKRVNVELVGNITNDDFCRLSIINFTSDRKFKKIITSKSMLKFFSYQDKDECSTNPENYIFSSRDDIPNFLIRMVRDDVDSILTKLEKRSGRTIKGAHLKTLNFTSYKGKGNIIMYMEFKSDISTITYNAFVDIKEGKFVILDSSFGERI